MIDPQFVEAAFRTSTSRAGGIVPTAEPTHVKPIPTVIPNVPIFEKAGQSGYTTFWVVFVVLLISTLVFAFLAYRTPVQKRVFHVITTLIAVISTLSYFALATRTGFTFAHFLVRETHKHDIPTTVDHVFRQLFWVRYIDWALTTALTLLNLSFLAGINGANILVALSANFVLVFTGLFAALARGHNARWGWYAMSVLAYLVIVFQLIVPGRRAANVKADNQTAKLFAAISAYTIVLWAVYLVVWAVSDEARKISVNTEIITYAVLDILAKPVLGFWLLFAHGKRIAAIDGFWSHGLVAEGAVRLEDDEA